MLCRKSADRGCQKPVVDRSCGGRRTRRSGGRGSRRGAHSGRLWDGGSDECHRGGRSRGKVREPGEEGSVATLLGTEGSGRRAFLGVNCGDTGLALKERCVGGCPVAT